MWTCCTRSPNRDERVLGSVALSLLVSLAALTGRAVETADETAQETTTGTASPDGTWTMGTRTVTVPVDISDALRASLSETPAPDVEARRSAPQRTEEEWREDQLTSSQASLDEMSEQLGVSIERDEIDGVPVYRVTPRESDAQQTDHLFLHVHGGAYVFGGGDASVREAALVSTMTGLQALSVDYRMKDPLISPVYGDFTGFPPTSTSTRAIPTPTNWSCPGRPRPCRSSPSSTRSC